MDVAVSPACTIHKCCRMEWTEDEIWLVLQALLMGHLECFTKSLL